VRDGQHMRLAGQGGAGYGGGSAGDLYLEVHIARQANLTVDGRDVYQTARVTPWEVALGGAIDVNMPAGKIQVTVPPASQGGRKLRLKGRGIPAMSAQEVAGDLYLVLEVYVPPAANEQQRKLYDSLAREMAFNPRAETGT
jgi:curved DNA-binding protein